MTNFIEKYLKETLDKIFSQPNGPFKVRNIRRNLEIKSNNRSRIRFISRSLRLMEDDGFLESFGSNPKSYKITFDKEKVTIPEIMNSIMTRKKVSSSSLILK